MLHREFTGFTRTDGTGYFVACLGKVILVAFFNLNVTTETCEARYFVAP